ncbi:cell division protein FtsA [Candidatus Sneabacter namystus]|uniref:Cell division protein FtsA n=1 Tax=Candidatus Sneabacter namystus TaxID=2601646 RepID=A0A5C0UHZ0_9RICK|nr:cell division protein FtsA [Candidatus Sneabacter namystus]QEK39708.1 cell division protein FtsA [Candidatus Sneabacter namystus]
MRKKANFVCLDIGSHKVALLAAKVNSESDAEVLVHQIYASEGFGADGIVDLKKAERTLSKVLYNAEKLLKSHISNITVAISSKAIESKYARQTLVLNNTAVTKDHINSLLSQSVKKFEEAGKSVMHCFPIEFCVDGQSMVKNPVGMICNKINGLFHIMTLESNALLNLTGCFVKCHVSVDEFFVSGVASGISAISTNVDGIGALVIDCGAMKTSFTVFHDNLPVFSSSIPIGGWHVTNDIAHVLSVNFDVAEKLKVLYANLTDNAPTLTLEAERKGQVEKINSVLLNEIIKSRESEIFSMIAEKCHLLDIEPCILQNIVLMGGASDIDGLDNLCGSIFRTSNVRNFSCYYDGILSNESNINSYATVLGMLEYRMKHHAQYSRIINTDCSSSILYKTFSFFKNLFN